MAHTDRTARNRTSGPISTPFDAAYLDRLMDEAGIDVLLATSKHNVQYMLGGYRPQFFAFMDAMGVSRFLPILIYPKGAPENAAYIAHRTEVHKLEVAPVWVPEVRHVAQGTTDATEEAIARLRSLGLEGARIGIERAFLPLDAAELLAAQLPASRRIEALPVLERLRAVKRPDELAKLREASERIIDSMLATISGCKPGVTKNEIVEALKREEAARGLDFEYCLITAGTSLNRAPSDERWEAGAPLSLDSGGNYAGYIGDLTRMAVLGEPDDELVALLAKVDRVQHAAFDAVAPGRPAGDVFFRARAALEDLPEHRSMHFVAHGMGLITHEVPHLPTGGRMSYRPSDADRPLEAGFVLSLETTLQHPRRGFIKLEDTLAVTDEGYELLGERGRGWNTVVLAR